MMLNHAIATPAKKEVRNEPWKNSPLGCLVAAGDTASHTTVSAPIASVRSLFFILAWKSGMDNWTAMEEGQDLCQIQYC